MLLLNAIDKIYKLIIWEKEAYLHGSGHWKYPIPLIQVSKFKRKSVGGSTNRRPVSSDNQGAYDKLLKTSFIMSNIRKSIK